jgi:DNA-directed RNA polymerase specialized sigma subunit
LADPTNDMLGVEADDLDDVLVGKIRECLRIEDFVLFELRFLKGMTSAEIAAEKGITKISVDSRCSRIVKKLRHFFKSDNLPLKN